VSGFAEAIRALPKVEIHLHIEGAVPLPALFELVRKYGGAREVATLRALEERFRYRDFPHFLSTWMWKNGFLREYEDFSFIAFEVATDLARQNVRYVEAFHSPGDFAMLHGLDVARITEAVRKGLDEETGVEVRLIADLTRDFGPERGMKWLSELASEKSMKIVGIGIGGSEHAFPPEPYRDVYRQARRLGLRTTAHAGEAAGPSSIWGALRVLEVDRIGHGTRAGEDVELVRYLEEHRVPIEMCPISNLRTGVVPDMERHPIRDFFDRGLLVSVNTDDPKMFETSLEAEYLSLAEHLGFTLDEIRTLVENAIESTWADEATKKRLREELAASAARG
jgi:adenosine deaminase